MTIFTSNAQHKCATRTKGKLCVGMQRLLNRFHVASSIHAKKALTLLFLPARHRRCDLQRGFLVRLALANLALFAVLIAVNKHTLLAIHASIDRFINVK